MNSSATAVGLSPELSQIPHSLLSVPCADYESKVGGSRSCTGFDSAVVAEGLVDLGSAGQTPLAGHRRPPAVFFVAAFAIERLLEPLAALLIPKQNVADDLSASMGAAADATTNFYHARAAHAHAAYPLADAADAREEGRFARDAGKHRSRACDTEESPSQPRRSSGRQSRLSRPRIHTHRCVLGISTIVAMLSSASLHSYFLQPVGISSATRGLEILATGLIIGAENQTPARCHNETRVHGTDLPLDATA
ncbi:hypothetical protein GGC64_005915 [Mycobacterium sp. OAS707]|uniref:hypothetical protein n=1 Tax=Mycobacterium sp. OAS707 TaxID=2663822 RepID=UPI00178BAC86|nr:hypothetical protein [Mycobacterium sp. OAS707]MBE1551828.1 hypothetical protein [Mycobacterium sp. OAS707]